MIMVDATRVHAEVVKRKTLSKPWLEPDPSCPDIRKPDEILLVDGVCRDAGLILHRFCDPEAPCSIGCDLGADLGPLAGAAQRRRGLKDCRTSDHGWGDNRKLKDRNSVQHEIGGNMAAPKVVGDYARLT